MWGSFLIGFSPNALRLHQVLFSKRLLLLVGNKVKRANLKKKRWLQENKARKISRKVRFLATATGLEPTNT